MSRLLERSSVTLASRYERPRLQISTDAAYFYGRCTCRGLHLSVCLSVTRLTPTKTDEPIEKPF